MQIDTYILLFVLTLCNVTIVKVPVPLPVFVIGQHTSLADPVSESFIYSPPDPEYGHFFTSRTKFQ
jgi:hypothetical protein